MYVVVPGNLDTRTGGYGYDRRIIAGLRERGWVVEVVRLDEGFPVPSPASRAHAADAFAAIPDGSLVLVLSRRLPGDVKPQVPDELPHSPVFFGCKDIQQTCRAIFYDETGGA